MNAPEQLQIEFLPLDSLHPFATNARTHSKKQIHQILASIQEFGFTNPIIVDAHNTIICGHGRVEAAKLANLNTVPAIRLEYLSDSQKRAYIIADNKIALNSGWDPEILSIELQNLLSSDVDFDLEVTGFDTAEIDFLIDGSAKEQNADAGVFLGLDQVPVSALGDIWLLGTHKLACADARNKDPYIAILERPARLVFADPPYNVPVDGHVCKAGEHTHREFTMASGEMTSSQFITFLSEVFKHAVDHSLDGAIHFIAMDWRHVSEMVEMGRPLYSELKNICVWNKTVGGMGSFYRSKHEFIFVFKVGSSSHINNIELGRSGRYRTNIWDYCSPAKAKGVQQSISREHPTVKPVALVIDAIKDCSRRGEIVLDPFSGSGTTIVAAEKCGRHARAIEIDPLYVDLSIRRWQELTGFHATLESNGRSFTEVTAQREVDTEKYSLEN